MSALRWLTALLSGAAAYRLAERMRTQVRLAYRRPDESRTAWRHRMIEEVYARSTPPAPRLRLVRDDDTELAHWRLSA